MSAVQPNSKIGLFADGAVGDAVLRIITQRCRERLAYVAIPALDSVVARSHASLALTSELLVWCTSDTGADLPYHAGSVPEIILLAWWPRLVPGKFLSAGQTMTLNMHPSLLPFGRGKDPNFWALVDGEPFGVSIHHVETGIDDGPIAFQSQLTTDWTDTGSSLYEKAQARMIALFAESLDDILSLKVPRRPQPPDTAGFHRRADLAPRSAIDLDATYTARELLNLLRARSFRPHPACRFSENGETYEVRVDIEKTKEQT